MDFFLSKKIVEYACLCGVLSPLTKLYFCRHCLNLRCAFCCHHEVDSHFCSNCLENIPSSEAKLRKNKCNTCFDCPSCQATLSARATSIQVPMSTKGEGGDETDEGSASNKMVTKKMYYLACLACRWTSRDVGISDQTSQTCSWPEQEYFHSTRFQLLSEHFQAVVLCDKEEKQDYLRRKTVKTSKFPSMTDRTGLTVASIRRQIGFDKSAPKAKPKPTNITPSIATSEVEDLPDEIFTKPVNLKNITTIKQRLAQPANQPETVKHLYPQHKNLSIKRSLRCRHCEHNVIKPEYNPSSIKYRIQLFASNHVPEVRFVKADPFKIGESASIILKIINPTINDMTITIMDLPTEDEEKMAIEEMRKTFDKSVSIATKSSLTPSIMRPSLIEDPRMVDCKITGKIELPDSSFVVNQRDDSAEFDDDIQGDRQDPRFIIWRKANKVEIKLNVIPCDGLKKDDDIITGFTMQFTYSNVHTSTPEKESQGLRHALNVRVYINPGKISE
ncbi:CLUMA_CG001875, isoform A [Clunio marinus]|uniref:Dynactin subunit 4 n=1 Tax=Clunio marinus TaxID=568069 RepID=A0A1J1HKN3_9DIPT|nr:CLUMA_CG001875, isoform A [Clunio marinus]